MAGYKRWVFASVISCLTAFSVSGAEAVYPDRPIKMLVVSAAGGATDIIARMVGDSMSHALGQPIVIENQTGGGGVVAMHTTALAQPDGYTLVLTSAGPLVASPFMYSKPPYDAEKDFAPISLLARNYQYIVVRSGFPAKNVSEFLAYVKANPGKVSAGNGGVGSSSYLAEGQLNKLAGLQMKIVPYAGGAVAIVDTMGGHIDMVVSDPLAFVESFKTGKVRPIGTLGIKPSKLLPDLQVVNDLVPGVNALGWYGILAPAKTPPDIVHRLSKAAADAVKEANVVKYFAVGDQDVVGNTPEEFADVIKKEAAEYHKLVNDLNIRLD